jgi:flavin reductase (DIM6/NTAB) family NADH-FMN oxidoreductase RutF
VFHTSGVASAFESLKIDELTSSDAYDLLTSLVVPRPIAFVSTVSGEGVPNLAPFSFFTLGGVHPASLLFSATTNVDGSEKVTLQNVLATGEFVVNTVHREMFEGMGNAAAPPDPGLPKWERSGFAQMPSLQVRPPRIAESLAQFECRVHQVVRHGEGAGAARYVIGEVLVAHVSEQLFESGRLSPRRVRAIARLGGRTYLDTHGEPFEA